jgi:hypothetical protein
MSLLKKMRQRPTTQTLPFLYYPSLVFMARGVNSYNFPCLKCEEMYKSINDLTFGFDSQFSYFLPAMYASGANQDDRA